MVDIGRDTDPCSQEEIDAARAWHEDCNAVFDMLCEEGEGGVQQLRASPGTFGYNQLAWALRLLGFNVLDDAISAAILSAFFPDIVEDWEREVSKGDESKGDEGSEKSGSAGNAGEPEQSEQLEQPARPEKPEKPGVQCSAETLTARETSYTSRPQKIPTVQPLIDLDFINSKLVMSRTKFLLFTRVLRDYSPMDMELREAFPLLDADKDGLLTVEDLARFAEMFNIPMSADDLADIMEAADVDDKGVITLDAFLNLLKRP